MIALDLFYSFSGSLGLIGWKIWSANSVCLQGEWYSSQNDLKGVSENDLLLVSFISDIDLLRV